MNCEEARLRIGAEPAAHSSELAAHLAGCADCRKFHGEMNELEGRIRRAFEAPPELGVRRAAAPRFAWRPLAMAAGILVATLGFFGVWLLRPSDSLAHDVVVHVQEEPDSWLARQGVSAAGIGTSLGNAGVALDVTSDRITYAQSCWFHGHYVPHLVVQTSQGPATVLLLRHERVPGPRRFSEGGMSGVIVPSGEGSIAVIAHGPDMAPVAQEMQRELRWLPEPPQPPPPKG